MHTSCSGVVLQWPGARALGGGGVESSAVGVALRDCPGEPSLSEPLEFMSEPYELAERIELAVAAATAPTHASIGTSRPAVVCRAAR